MELHRAGYVAQISAYIKSGQAQSAYALSREMEAKFPDDALAAYLVAESSFWCGDMHEAALEARKAFNRMADPRDLAACAVLGATAYYEMREYWKGLEFLKAAKALGRDAQIDRLLVLMAMALGDTAEAARHLDDLYKTDPKAAEELADRLA
ncbi:hypothetical protein L0Y65_02720 [Candidatus Micrarchaeota archaeon]|nr:hypothetical protein [Candidatus Micrarchaeota archaeon]